VPNISGTNKDSSKKKYITKVQMKFQTFALKNKDRMILDLKSYE